MYPPCKPKTCKQKYSLWIVLLLFQVRVFSQFYELGQDPASLRWKQINTENFQIIFPSDFEKEAKRLANMLDYLYNPVSKTLHHRPQKISVLLHNHSSYSNGMVVWAPKIMDLYPTPSQDSYASDWLDQLAVHELRHVVQIDKLNQGITHIAGILFGEQAVGTVSGLLPRWFFEGDAVNNETALSSTGRGRTASFEMEMKALVTSRDSLFSYEKALRGSYKDYVPNAYYLGYPIIAWTRKNYGESVFDNSLNYISQNPYTLFPFPISLKKATGLPLRKLYKASYSDLKSQWSRQISSTHEDNDLVWNNTHKKAYTNYQFPQYVNDTTLLAVKSGIDQLTEFVFLYKNGKETRVHTPGYYSIDKFSYAAGKYCWAERVPDVRWSNRSYYCIKVGSLETGKIKMLTKKTRYFAPALSPDGTKIAAVEVTVQNEYYLVILDAKTGTVLERIASVQNKFLQLPEWLNDGTGIVMITSGQKGKDLEIFDSNTRLWKSLIPPTFRNINYPADAGNFVFFASDDNGTDNLYAISKSDAIIWKVTDVKFGATAPNISPKNNSAFFSKYSSQGYDIVSMSLDQKKWKNITGVSDLSPKLYTASAKQENFNFQDSVIPQKDYAVRNYSKIGHLINIHSWAPFYYNYNNISIDNTVYPGVSVLSQNYLGTCVSTLGYSYRGGQSYLNTDITYEGLYPVIDFSMSYGGTTSYTTMRNIAAPSSSGAEADLTTRIYLPLNFTRGHFIKGITPLVAWQYLNNWFYNPYITRYVQGVSYISYVLSTYCYMRQSSRDLAPHWGAIFYSRYTSAPFRSSLLGSIWYVQGKFYLPGLLHHHSLQFSVGYQEQVPASTSYYYSGSFLSFPRGYTTYSTYKLNTFTSTYAFPLFYPDFALGPIFYLKRIRSNLFCDIAKEGYKYRNNEKNIVWGSANYISTGIDLLADFHFLRIIFPIQAGVRMVYFPQTNEYTSQLLFNIDLSNY
jgi:hypothetical protein